MGAFVIKGGEIYDPAAQKWEKKDIAIENGMENKKVLKLTDFQKNEENPFMKHPFRDRIHIPCQTPARFPLHQKKPGRIYAQVFD